MNCWEPMRRHTWLLSTALGLASSGPHFPVSSVASSEHSMRQVTIFQAWAVS